MVQECEYSYIIGCSRDNSTWCGGSASTFQNCSVIMPLGVPFDPTQSPQCSCFAGAQCPNNGSACYCDQSQCDPNQNPINACQYPIPGTTNFLPTGTCMSYRHGQPDQTAIDSTDWRCSCGAVHTNTNTQCNVKTDISFTDCVFYDRSNGPGSRCEIPKAGCTWVDTTTLHPRITLCNDLTSPNGQSVCIANITNTSLWYCNCPPDYYGTYCQYQNTTYCGGTCQTAGSRCLNDICYCGEYYTGTNCSTDLCLSTGGLYNVSTIAGTCVCPSGSIWIASTNIDVTRTSKGCLKQCPLYNGYECGGEKYILNNQWYYRCSSRSTIANSSTTLTCNCAYNGYPGGKENQLGYFMPFLLDPAGSGSCVPYCVNGGTYNSNTGLCTCTSSRYSGLRCNITICSGKGKLINGVCICDNYLDDPTTNCSSSLCQLPAASIPTANLQHCTCNQPYVVNPYNNTPPCLNPCINGIANTTLSQCICDNEFWWGTYCDQTDCIPSTINLTNNSCTCVNGGLWNESISTCTSIECGYGISNGIGGCNCPSVWTGSTCDIDACSMFNNGTIGRDLITGDWICNCIPGYYTPSIGSLCTATYCTPGIPISCGGINESPCIYPHFGNYNCLCGQNAWFLEGRCIVDYVCLYGTLFVNITTGQPYCQCIPGYTGPMCQTPLCDFTNALIYWDIPSQSCQCYPPFSDASTGCYNVTLCGPGMDIHNGPILLGNNGTMYQCQCSIGYTLNDSIAGYPCVVACDPNGGTAYPLVDGCVCNTAYAGDYCEIAPIIGQLSNSNDSFPLWAIGIIIVAALVIVGLGMYLVYRYAKDSSTRTKSSYGSIHKRKKKNVV